MAEVLATVGIIASIVQLVEFSGKVIRRIDDFRGSVKDVPAALKDVSVQLPLLLSDLKRTKTQAEDGNLDVDTQNAVLAIVQSCQEHIQTLDEILLATLPMAGDSHWKLGKKALLSLKQDEKIHDISERLRDHVIYLTHHIVTNGVQSRRRAPTMQSLTPELMIPFKRDAKNFIGRNNLMEALDIGFEVYDRLSLVGLGGVGKSQIAIEFAYRVRERQPNTWVFWVHVNSRSRFKQSYADIARKLKLPKIEHPEHDALQEVTDWLTKESNGRWLLILDNCDDPEVITHIEPGMSGAQSYGGVEEKPLIEYLPEVSHGKILATCRNKEAAMTMTDFEADAVIPVMPMSSEEAIALLRTKLPKDKSSEADLSSLANELGYIPLAIKQAAAYISVTGASMNVSKYLKLFRKSEDSQTKLLLKDFNDKNRDRELKNSIISTWQISFDQIRSSNPAAVDLLALMSSFDRQGIPRYLLCEEDDFEFEESISPLINFSLITELDEDSYTMHRLVQLTTQTWLEARKQQMKWWEEALTSLTKAFPDEDYDNWKTCQLLYPHAQLMSSRHFTSASSREAVSDLYRKLGMYDKAQGRYEAADQRLRESYNIRNNLFGENHKLTLASLHSVGSVLEREGKWQEAEETHQKTLTLRRRLFGDDDAQTLESTNSLCLDLIDEGRYAMAVTLLRQALESERATLAPEHTIRLTSMTYLAEALAKQGHLTESVEIHREVLEVQDRIHDHEHPETLETLNHLGRRLSDLGRLDAAEKMLGRAFKSKDEILGPEHPSTLETLSALIDNQERQGKFNEATDLLRDLVGLHDRVFGHDHPTTLESLNHFAFSLNEIGDWQEALRILEEILSKNERQAGKEHPLTLRIRRNIAKCYQDNTDPAEAASLHREVLAIQERTLGADSPDTNDTVMELTHALSLMGDFEEAQRMSSQALQHNIAALGEEHERTLTCYEHKAFILLRMKRWANAAHEYREVSKKGIKVFGPNHPTTEMANHNLTFCLMETAGPGDFKEAEDIQRAMLPSKLERYGWENDATLSGTQVLARALLAQGKIEEAEEICRKTYDLEIKVLGKDYWRTNKCREILAEIYQKQGKELKD